MPGETSNRLENSLDKNGGAKRRELLKVVAAGALVYSAPSVASFSMDGLKVGQAQAFGFSSNMTLGVGSNMPHGGSGPFARLIEVLRGIFSRFQGI